MTIDRTGVALATLMAAAGFGPPALPSNPTEEQINAYNTAVTAQAAAYSIILTYIVQNTIVHTTVATTVLASGLLDSGGHACTGTAHGIGTGTGTIT